MRVLIFLRPTIPALAQVRPDAAHFPIVLVNDTGLSDDEVYFTAYGKATSGMNCITNTNFSFVDFGKTPSGPFTETGMMAAPPTMTGSTSAYSYKFSDIPLSSGQRIIYLPYINAGIVLFSVGPLTVNTALNSIAVPAPTDPTDPAYTTVYGSMEISFFPSTCMPMLNELTIDFTCVDYYGLSIYMNLYTDMPAPGLPQNRPSGIYQSRHYTLCSLQNAFREAFPASRSQWDSLVIKDGSGKILRVGSPGYAMSHAGGTFDKNYLDNAAAYGYSWRNDVWNGTYYASGQHDLTLVTADMTSFTGNTSGGNFDFVAGMEVARIPWVDMSTPSTFTAIFNVAQFFPGMQYSTDGGTTFVPASMLGSPQKERAENITKQLSSVITGGLIPGKVSSLPANGFFQDVIHAYYMKNLNLTSIDSSTGSWFDLYGRGVFSDAVTTGNILYGYPCDDYFYFLASFDVASRQDVGDDSTYGIVILGPYSDE